MWVSIIIIHNTRFSRTLISEKTLFLDKMQIQRELRKSQLGGGKKGQGRRRWWWWCKDAWWIPPPAPNPLSPLCKFLVEKSFYYKNSRNKIRSGKEKKRENSRHNKIINKTRNFLTYSKKNLQKRIIPDLAKTQKLKKKKKKKWRTRSSRHQKLKKRKNKK